MAAKEFPLRLKIEAVDKATANLRAINKRIAETTAPLRRLNNSFRALSAEAGIPRIVKSFRGVGSSIGGVGREVGALGLKIGAMAAGAVVGLLAIVRSTEAAGSRLEDNSKRVGLSVDAYAQLEFAAKRSGIENEAFASAMDRLNKGLGEAKAGGGSMLAFLEKVSPALARQVMAASGTEEALALMTDAFGKIQDPARRAALAAAVFGKSGLQMGQFLGRGSLEIEVLRKQFFLLSGSQQRFADTSGEMGDALDNTGAAFLGLRNAAAGALFPALTEVAKAVTELVAGNREGLREWAATTGKAISEWVATGGLDRLSTGLWNLGQSAKGIVESLGGMKNTAILAGLAMSGPLIASVVSLVSSLAGLIISIGSSTLVLKGFAVAIGAAGSVATAVSGAFAFIAPMFASMASGVLAMTTAIAPFVAAAGGLALAGYAIHKEWSNIKELFTDFLGPGGLLSTMREMLFSLEGLNPFAWLETAGQWWGKQLFGADGARPSLGADSAAPTAAAGQSEAKVTVDFNNMPQGARASMSSQSTAEVNMSVGYSMSGI